MPTKLKYSKPKAKKHFFRMKTLTRPPYISDVLTHRISAKSGKYFVRSHGSEEPRRIMEELRAAGLNVEEPGKTSQPKVTVSRSIGAPLYTSILYASRKTSFDLLPKAFELVGKMHAKNVCHGHPHANNLVVRGNDVWLIDFKLAKRVSPDWSSAQAILDAFERDYHFLGKIPRTLASTFALTMRPLEPKTIATLKRRCTESLIAQYPCSEAVKKELLKKVEAHLW